MRFTAWRSPLRGRSGRRRSWSRVIGRDRWYYRHSVLYASQTWCRRDRGGLSPPNVHAAPALGSLSLAGCPACTTRWEGARGKKGKCTDERGGLLAAPLFCGRLRKRRGGAYLHVMGYRARRLPMRTAFLAVLSLLAVTAAAQSGRTVTVRVKTLGGQPVPYAVLSVDGAPYRIADESGALTLVMASRDSLPVLVKRIGFRPFDGWARRGTGDDTYEAVMQPLAAVIDTVRVVARQVTPLSRTGFYDRVDRVKKSAMLGEFISPEELEA